ncbi:MAG TPA: hypothetical protein DDZ68_04915 [Parvularcula sp.]|jgi:hypothetical protein|nr:hypothetical protein [Parvularcula sp.]
MKRSTIAALFIFSALLSACAFGSSGGGFVHGALVRVQVIRAAEMEAAVCVGRAEGAVLGEKLTVYRYLDPGSEGMGLIREDVGTIEVVELIDIHCARVRTFECDVKKDEIVERLPEDDAERLRQFI